MKCKLEGTEKQIYTTGNVLREKIHTKEKHLKNQKQIKTERIQEKMRNIKDMQRSSNILRRPCTRKIQSEGIELKPVTQEKFF